MKDWLTKAEAVALIAARLGVDHDEAEAEFRRGAHDGKLTIRGVIFGLVERTITTRATAGAELPLTAKSMYVDATQNQKVRQADIDAEWPIAEKSATKTHLGAPPKVREAVAAWLEKLPSKDKGLSAHKLAESYVAAGGAGAVDSVRKIIAGWQNRQKRI